MQNPRVTIDQKKLEDNLSYLTYYCQEKGIQVAAVTKVINAYPGIVSIYDGIEAIKYLADSRIENIENYPVNSKKETLLLRTPMLSEADRVVKSADISLNSEIKTVRKLNEQGQIQSKIHKIILMIDFGDLREGIFEEREFFEYLSEIKDMPHIELYGLGTNLTCYGAIIPTYEILGKLVSYKQKVKALYDIDVPILSGGNSSSLYLLDSDNTTLDPDINMLRIGEAFVLGVETAFAEPIPHMHQDVFTLYGEIVEYRDKPSYPIGEVGQNAFGEKPYFEDKGTMRRGIIALGKQDVNHSAIVPVDSRLEIIGSSSDHMIIDFTLASEDYELGSEVAFQLEYGSLLSVFTSKYVNKYII